MKKVSELEGAELDYWAAKAENHELLGWDYRLAPGGVYAETLDGQESRSVLYSPSTDWSQGGPIIERERISVYLTPGYVRHKGLWTAALLEGFEHRADDPLVAAMRALVASKYGEEVPCKREGCDFGKPGGVTTINKAGRCVSCGREIVPGGLR